MAQAACRDPGAGAVVNVKIRGGGLLTERRARCRFFATCRVGDNCCSPSCTQQGWDPCMNSPALDLHIALHWRQQHQRPERTPMSRDRKGVIGLNAAQGKRCRMGAIHSFGLTLSMPNPPWSSGVGPRGSLYRSFISNAVKPLATSEATSEARAEQRDTAHRQSPPREVPTQCLSSCLPTWGIEADSGLPYTRHHDNKRHRSCDTKIGSKQYGSNASSHHRTQDHTPCLRSRLRTTHRRRG